MTIEWNDEARATMISDLKKALREQIAWAAGERGKHRQARDKLRAIRGPEGGAGMRRADLAEEISELRQVKMLVRSRMRGVHVLYAFLRGTSLRNVGFTPGSPEYKALLSDRPGLVFLRACEGGVYCSSDLPSVGAPPEQAKVFREAFIAWLEGARAAERSTDVAA